MKIFVTGGGGAVGKATVKRLVDHGHQVKVIGRTPGVEILGADYEVCDIGDYLSLREAVLGFDRVVHLAAIPNPSAGTSNQVFHSNVQGTFNVFKACEEEGIQRIVQASSINALGVFYGLKPAPIEYLPVDEEHPCLSTDVYSFSKQMIEEIGDYYWQRSGIASVALRLPYVAAVEFHEINKSRQDKMKDLCDRLLRLSSDERRRWFDECWKDYNEMRARGFLETPGRIQRMRNESPDLFDQVWLPMTNRVNFWTCLDERDSAQAIEKSLMADTLGSQVLFVNDDQNWTGVASSVLAELFYPDVKNLKKPLVGLDTLVSIDRAKQLIGFEVEYTFGNQAIL